MKPLAYLKIERLNGKSDETSESSCSNDDSDDSDIDIIGGAGGDDGLPDMDKQKMMMLDGKQLLDFWSLSIRMLIWLFKEKVLSATFDSYNQCIVCHFTQQNCFDFKNQNSFISFTGHLMHVIYPW